MPWPDTNFSSRTSERFTALSAAVIPIGVWLGYGYMVTQAAALVQEKVPGSSASDVRLWEEGDDGRTRYEGDLLYGGIKYEFEIDPRTGRILRLLWYPLEELQLRRPWPWPLWRG